MCQFLSVLILKNGDVLHHPMLDSHSDLVTYFSLPDTSSYVSHFAKAELTPVNYLDASTWQWRIDEPTRPSWLDDVEAIAEAKARAIAQKMIIATGAKCLIVDGCWIVGGDAVVQDVRGGRIIHVGDSAQITDVRDSAQITNVGDSAQITNVWGSARITDVRDSAQITNVWGSARITNVWDSAQITDVGGSAQLDASAEAHVKAGA